jgi:putative ABC transport system permease protein
MKTLRYAVRALLKTPGFTITAIVTLMLGTGINTAVFSMVNAVLLRDLPYRDPARLISVWEEFEKRPSTMNSSGATLGADSAKRANASPANLAAYVRGTRSFEGLSALAGVGMNLTGAGTPERLSGQRVSFTFFSLLDVAPVLGRDFRPEEDRPGAPGVIILTDDLWRRRFGADPQILNRSLLLDGNTYQVVGVLPPGFQSPSEFIFPGRIDFYVPAAFSSAQLAAHGDHNLGVLGRLVPTASIRSAQAELDSVSAALAREFPETNQGLRAIVVPLDTDLRSDLRKPMGFLLGAAALAVLIACVNVANLFLVRGVARRREIAVRFALGASRARVFRDFVVESLVLSAAGCAAGLLLGSFLIDILVRLAPASIPKVGTVGLDARVFLFSAALAVITGVIFGLFPAWQASRRGPGESIKSSERGMSGRAQGRSRAALVIAEISMAAVLLIGAALLIQSFVRVLGMDLGFSPERVLAMNINLPNARYATPESQLRFYEDLERRVAALPGVERVTFGNRMPLRGGWGGSVVIEGSEFPEARTDRQAVSAGYFETLGIRLQRGRLFTDADRSGRPAVVVVNQTFARQYLPGQDPLGRRIKIVDWMTIIGIVNDIRRGGKEADIKPQAFIPALQLESYASSTRLASFGVRTSGDPRQMVRAIRDQVLAIDKDQPITGVVTLEEVITASVAVRRFQVTLLIAFASVAMLLALVGIFGVLSHSVRQRTVELGIRMALGAPQRSILAMVLKQASLWIAIGLAIGLGAAYALSRSIESLLFGVGARDLRIYALAAVLLAAIAMLAAAIPARRAAKVDPMVALRYE